MKKKSKNNYIKKFSELLTPRKREVIGLSLIIIASSMILSIIMYHPKKEISNHIFGKIGEWMSSGPYNGFGYSSLMFSGILLIIGYILFTKKNFLDYWSHILKLLVSAIWFFTFCGYLSQEGSYLLKNWPDEFLSRLTYPGFAGTITFGTIDDLYLGEIVLVISFLFIFTWIFNISNYDLLKKINKHIQSFLAGIIKKKNKDVNLVKEPIINLEENEVTNKETTNNDIVTNNQEDNSSEDKLNDSSKDEDVSGIVGEGSLDTKETLDNTSDVIIEDEMEVEQGDIDIERKSEYFNYKLPSIEDLDNPVEITQHNEDELKRKADEIVYAINSFGVSCEVVKISPGPVITLFEVEPAEGVRVNKITNLAEDLSRIMGGKRVRVIDNIPGTRSVGIELPNDQPSTVYLRTIINSSTYIENNSKLKIALGKTTTGDAFVFDLGKMPHLLVAGATGAGKSVCINTIIVSILYNAKPDEVKFILMDPKKVELSTYKSLVGYHLVTAKNIDEYVMTTADNSCSILESAINEMEKRFQLFSETRVRNIQEYHQKQTNNSDLEIVPYIIVIIDELADLMMTSGRAIEEPITRLAQKARAVGIHLIVATQRPSVDVITGLIKSNFPARMSFQVASKIDSRTIIDQSGAEKLLGRGDMLFLLPGSAAPIRLHNAFITLEEIEKIMMHISGQPKPEELKLPEIKKKQKGNDNEFSLDDNQDELLKDAAKLVVDYNQASVSLLQRKFRIGYSRAGRLIDELESLGIVSPYNGSKARDVLKDHNYLDEIFGE